MFQIIKAYYLFLLLKLGQILQRDAPQVPIEICDLETNGVVLRYCPLEMGGEKIPDANDIGMFILCLEQQLVSEEIFLLEFLFCVIFLYFLFIFLH